MSAHYLMAMIEDAIAFPHHPASPSPTVIRLLDELPEVYRGVCGFHGTADAATANGAISTFAALQPIWNDLKRTPAQPTFAPRHLAILLLAALSSTACSLQVCTRWDTFALQPSIPHCADAPSSPPLKGVK
jgi:hypothetical protein